jgi:outer membrane receptor protein involved in Fe transport
MAVTELSSAAAQARKAAEAAAEAAAAAQQEPELVEATTAFIVYILPDGSVRMTPDLNKAIATQREPSIDEITGAVAAISQQLLINKVSMATTQLVVPNVIHNLNALGQQMAEQEQAAKLASALKV